MIQHPELGTRLCNEFEATFPNVTPVDPAIVLKTATSLAETLEKMDVADSHQLVLLQRAPHLIAELQNQGGYEAIVERLEKCNKRVADQLPAGTP